MKYVTCGDKHMPLSVINTNGRLLIKTKRQQQNLYHWQVKIVHIASDHRADVKKNSNKW